MARYGVEQVFTPQSPKDPKDINRETLKQFAEQVNADLCDNVWRLLQ